MERHWVFAPCRSHQVKSFIHPSTSIGELLTNGRVLRLGPADARPDNDAATREGVEAGQRVGQCKRLMHGYHQHAGAKANSLGARAGPGEASQRIEEVGGRVGLGGRMHNVVTYPYVGKAQFFKLTEPPQRWHVGRPLAQTEGDEFPPSFDEMLERHSSSDFRDDWSAFILPIVLNHP